MDHGQFTSAFAQKMAFSPALSIFYDLQSTAYGVLVNQLGIWAWRIVFKLVEEMKVRLSGATAQRRLSMSNLAGFSVVRTILPDAEPCFSYGLAGISGSGLAEYSGLPEVLG